MRLRRYNNGNINICLRREDFYNYKNRSLGYDSKTIKSLGKYNIKPYKINGFWFLVDKKNNVILDFDNNFHGFCTYAELNKTLENKLKTCKVLKLYSAPKEYNSHGLKMLCTSGNITTW